MTDRNEPSAILITISLKVCPEWWAFFTIHPFSPYTWKGDFFDRTNYD